MLILSIFLLNRGWNESTAIAKWEKNVTWWFDGKISDFHKCFYFDLLSNSVLEYFQRYQISLYSFTNRWFWHFWILPERKRWFNGKSNKLTSFHVWKNSLAFSLICLVDHIPSWLQKWDKRTRILVGPKSIMKICSISFRNVQNAWIL